MVDQKATTCLGATPTDCTDQGLPSKDDIIVMRTFTLAAIISRCMKAFTSKSPTNRGNTTLLYRTETLQANVSQQSELEGCDFDSSASIRKMYSVKLKSTNLCSG
jgi:hypothetical protein